MSRNKYLGYCYMKRHGVKICIDNMESGVLNA